MLDTERGGPHERVAVRLPARRPRARAVRADAARDGHPGRQGVHAGDPAGARARGGDVRHRVPADGRGAALQDRARTSCTSSARAEVPLAAFHMGEIIDEADLPLRYAGYSTCFRREAGTYGKDMGGMFRVHQFDKVEMFAFTTPETSWDEHERLVAIEEEIVGNLELPYRVVNIAAGDLGGARREEVRHRGVAAGPGSLPRAHVVLELHRLPGAAAADARAPRRRHGRGAAHAQRHRDGDRSHADRAAGEPPAGRRVRRAPRGAAPVPARAAPARSGRRRVSSPASTAIDRRPAPGTTRRCDVARHVERHAVPDGASVVDARGSRS